MDMIWGLGRRKTATARIRLSKGTGKMQVNGQALEEYFNTQSSREYAVQPLTALGIKDKYDVLVTVSGGGKEGQSGAVLMGIARALMKDNPEYEKQLKDHEFLSRDPRMKERKKPGQRAARAHYQFSKR